MVTNYLYYIYKLNRVHRTLGHLLVLSCGKNTFSGISLMYTKWLASLGWEKKSWCILLLRLKANFVNPVYRTSQSVRRKFITNSLIHQSTGLRCIRTELRQRSAVRNNSAMHYNFLIHSRHPLLLCFCFTLPIAVYWAFTFMKHYLTPTTSRTLWMDILHSS